MSGLFRFSRGGDCNGLYSSRLNLSGCNINCFTYAVSLFLVIVFKTNIQLQLGN